MKYCKKSRVIDTFEYDGDLMNSVGVWYVPNWAVEAFKKGILVFDGEPESDLYIKTPEGAILVNVGDFVVKGVNGELYSCKPDIFEK